MRHASLLSARQWATLPEGWRHIRCKGIEGGKGVFGTELRRLGLGVRYQDVKDAFDSGIIKWHVKVLECIGFDTELYQRLVKGAIVLSAKRRKVESESESEFGEHACVM